MTVPLSSRRLATVLAILLSAISFVPQVQARDVDYVYGTDGSGVTRQLAVDRTPALYTSDFGDCLGGQSLFNITKFDAGYYADNLTIVFHLDGTTNIKNESLMVHISVDAYGESRFDMTFDPCLLNIYSLCPLNASLPITAWAQIPVGPQQIGGIPSIAFSIPDFEGSTTIQIFANSSQTEIGCFQAVMKNGATFSWPAAVGAGLGVATIVAMLASFFSAAYGVSIPHMRMHYAHSLPMFVILETYQTIFFSGALSVNWPSILIGWWSNFAWSAGLIYSSSIISAVDSFTSVSGNASQVGGAGSVVINNGGGLIPQIYGRGFSSLPVGAFAKRAAYNASDPFDYTWSGVPVTPGMPLPGTWSSFPGDLSGVNIPAPSAFIVGLIWFLVAVGLIAALITLFKLTLEALSIVRFIRKDRFDYFRSHWTGYLGHALARSVFTGFFAMTTLALYQLTLHSPAGNTAVAALVFVFFVLGVTTLVVYALRSRLRFGSFAVEPDQIVFRSGSSRVPYIIPALASTLRERQIELQPVFTVSWFRIRHTDRDPSRPSVHLDVEYVKHFGWYSARFRRTRWWFLAYYFVYQLGRACFIGAGVSSPLAQVYGLLVYEVLAFAIITNINPYEGQRNTAIAVWMLGLLKILTTGLSIAFLPAFNLGRIVATVVGVIIIVIQGFVVVGLLILIFLSAVSTWMSLSRNQEHFEPDYLEGARVRYFEKMEARAPDVWTPPKEKKSDKARGKEKATASEEPVTQTEPYFSVNSVTRAPKIEDDDGIDEDDERDVVADLDAPHNSSAMALDSASPRALNRTSRANSLSSRVSVSSLPRAARTHRQSWSSRDFAQWEANLERPDSSLAQRLSSTTGGIGSASGIGEAANRSMGSIGPLVVSPRASVGSLRQGGSPHVSPPGSPLVSAMPSRETLAKHAEERRYTATSISGGKPSGSTPAP